VEGILRESLQRERAEKVFDHHESKSRDLLSSTVGGGAVLLVIGVRFTADQGLSKVFWEGHVEANVNSSI